MLFGPGALASPDNIMDMVLKQAGKCRGIGTANEFLGSNKTKTEFAYIADPKTAKSTMA